MPELTLARLPVTDFLAQVAGASATPGGGSVSALAGAVSASLVAMVGGLTLGKAGYEDADGAMAGLQDQAHRLATGP